MSGYAFYVHFPFVGFRFIVYKLHFSGFIFIFFVNDNFLVLDHSFLDVNMLDDNFSIVHWVIELFF